MRVFATLAVAMLMAVHAAGYRILFALPVSTGYLNHFSCGIAKSLARSGNKVTIVSSLPPNFYHENVTTVKINEGKNLLQDLNQFKVNSTVLMNHVMEVIRTTGQAMWHEHKVKDLLKIRDEYDAIAIPAFLNELAYPFLKDYEGVFVTLHTRGVEQYIVSQAGLHSMASINPAMDDPYFGSYTLLDKFVHSLVTVNKIPVDTTGVLPGVQGIVQNYVQDMDDLTLYRPRSRLDLLDGNFALDGLTPLLPRQVEVGGVTGSPPTELPQEIRKFLRSAKAEGIVYVSLGTGNKSGVMPPPLKEALLEALGRLPYAVLWQYDGMDLPKKDNVYMRKHLPQQDILGHPDTRVFISHCSRPATVEAAYHGVVVLALPIALDQHLHAQTLVRRGAAISLDWRGVTSDAIEESVMTLAKEASYSHNMGNISHALRDQKESAGVRGAWWIEYMIRHRGAPLLQHRTGGHVVGSYCDEQLLQVWAAVASVVGFAVAGVLHVLCSCLCRCCRGSPTASAKLLKKKKQ